MGVPGALRFGGGWRSRRLFADASNGKPGAYGRPVVYFSVIRNKVVAVAYGPRQQVLGQAEGGDDYDASAFC
jgi:hypothetical protein